MEQTISRNCWVCDSVHTHTDLLLKLDMCKSVFVLMKVLKLNLAECTTFLEEHKLSTSFCPSCAYWINEGVNIAKEQDVLQEKLESVQSQLGHSMNPELRGKFRRNLTGEEIHGWVAANASGLGTSDTSNIGNCEAGYINGNEAFDNSNSAIGMDPDNPSASGFMENTETIHRRMCSNLDERENEPETFAVEDQIQYEDPDQQVDMRQQQRDDMSQRGCEMEVLGQSEVIEGVVNDKDDHGQKKRKRRLQSNGSLDGHDNHESSKVNNSIINEDKNGVKVKEPRKSHNMTHPSEYLYPCAVCNIFCIYPRSLGEHYSNAHPNGPWNCIECHATLASRVALYGHRKYTHNFPQSLPIPQPFVAAEEEEEIENADDEYGEMPQLSPQVTLPTSPTHSLLDPNESDTTDFLHLFTKKDVVRFPCPLCPKKYRTPQDLERHQVKHKRKKTFQDHK